MEGRLQQVLDTHNLACGAVIDAAGEVASEVGDFTAFASTGLVAALLGPYGSARETFTSLMGQSLPRMWSQGDEFAFADLPSEGLAVVVFGRGRLPIPERWAMSKAVGASIRLAFGGTQDIP